MQLVIFGKLQVISLSWSKITNCINNLFHALCSEFLTIYEKKVIMKFKYCNMWILRRNCVEAPSWIGLFHFVINVFMKKRFMFVHICAKWFHRTIFEIDYFAVLYSLFGTHIIPHILHWVPFKIFTMQRTQCRKLHLGWV